MSKKKEETRKRRYKNEEEKKKTHTINEQIIENCFKKFAGYWGIDRVVLNVTIEKVYNEKLQSQESKYCSIVKTPFLIYYQIMYGIIIQKYEYITAHLAVYKLSKQIQTILLNMQD